MRSLGNSRGNSLTGTPAAVSSRMMRVADKGYLLGCSRLRSYGEVTCPQSADDFTIAGGPAPVRAYIEALLPDVLEGRIETGRVFDRVTDLDGVPDGYRAMN